MNEMIQWMLRLDYCTQTHKLQEGEGGEKCEVGILDCAESYSSFIH